MARTSLRNVIRIAANSYKACALLFFNSVVVFAILNVFLFLAYKVKDRFYGLPTNSNRAINTLGMSSLRQVYPGFTDDDIRLLMKETWDRELEYDSLTQFKERAHAGKWVNVGKHGFRLSKDNGPWPPDPKNLNIFLFGGSTAFGYGVADDQTIASHLQEFLAEQSRRKAKVYNFGAGFFYSTQERALFSNLLEQGTVPHVAIFLDGLNDLYFTNGQPPPTRSLQQFADAARPDPVAAGQGMLAALPVQRLIDSIKERTGGGRKEKTEPSMDSYNDTTKLTAVLGRYLRNKRLIEAAARAFDVRPLFVWQPVPTYHYNLDYHLFRPRSFELHTYSQFGYALMASTVKDNPQDFREDFLWLADIQKDMQRPLYVDACHYTGEFSR
ncbi:MAG: hypothetical protein ACLQVF_09925, partial [Isosphaeraceae bacterium]